MVLINKTHNFKEWLPVDEIIPVRVSGFVDQLTEQGDVPVTYKFFIAALFSTFYFININIFRTQITFKTSVPTHIDVVCAKHSISPAVCNCHHIMRIFTLHYREKIVVTIILVGRKAVGDHHFTFTHL